MTPQELKNSILQLAIQGKLSERLPEDGTARDLLVDIPMDDSFEGQRVKQKIITDISEDDKPFDIPDTWEWVKLGAICVIARGGSPRPIKEYITTAPDGVNWIKIGDTEKNGKYISQTAEKIKPSGVSKSRMVHAGDFLLTNSMSFGRPYILKVDGCIHDGWLVISQSKEVFDQDYLYWMLSSYYAYMQFSDKVSGAVVKNLNSDKVANSVFPLPPLAEQKRIVAKIEELLPLIDRYEEAWTKLEEFNKRFPGDMQKSLLQMAIQGKLVEQRPEEGTARELLDGISIDDSVDGRRVKVKIVSQIVDDDKTFDIPESWEWVKLGNICTIARGGSPRPIKEYITTAPDGVNWIKIGDTEKNGKYISSTAEKIKPSGVSKSRMVHAGDFLLTNSMSFGRPYILKVDGCIHDGWLVISQSSEVFDQDYLYWMLSSGYAYSQFCEKVSGAVVKNLNSDKVANAVFPLPPLAEQKRIVDKLEELLPLCERLK
ncbi:MAG: restriction endonuclease subunit S [Candidatus Fimisoma sp.]|nr:restriction endonuclease subunit S [Candidatus Fimisoma sp.]